MKTKTTPKTDKVSKEISKTKSKTQTKTVAPEVQEEVTLAETTKKPGFVIPKLNPIFLLIPLVVLLIAIAAFYLRPMVIVASVNGEQISRLDLIQELEKQGGQQTLNKLITQTLIYQEATKQNVTVSDEEVNQEIASIEETLTQQGRNLDELLAEQNLTREDLTNDIRLQKLAETMAAKDITVTDEEVDQYLEENQDSIPQNINREEMKSDLRDQMLEQKKNSAVSEWVSSLMSGANIIYYKTF